MLFTCKFNFRGSTIKKTDKGEYHYCNLEDAEGLSSRFACDNSLDLSQFKKGDNVTATLDYSLKYESFKVLKLEKDLK